MNGKNACLRAFLGVVLIGTVSPTGALGGSPKLWSGRATEFEKFLSSAEITDVKELGTGVNQPKKVTLQQGSETMAAIWKPIQRGPKAWAWESYQAEVAAWEMDQMLGLEMVPPTVLREINGEEGSLQLWVNGFRQLSDLEAEPPDSEHWRRQLARVACFDNLISNWDRKPKDILVDADWNIVLIDHSQAFLSGHYLHQDPEKRPHTFDRQIVKELKQLKLEYLRFKFGRLLLKPQIDAIIARRERLLAYLDDLVEQKGENVVLFEANLERR